MQGFKGEGGTRTASTEFSRRGGKARIEAIVASLEADGFTRNVVLREIGIRLRGGALASLYTQGFTGEGGTRTASTELGHRGRGGALASLYTKGFTGVGGAASASTELARRGGEANSAICRKSGDCAYAGCTLAIATGSFCKHHQPKKTEKSDKCRDCGRVFVAKERVRAGVCYLCYKKPETVAIRTKATAEKNAA